YDARGSELFEQICNLPEYYPTRTETGVLRRHASDIARRVGADAQIVEYGSGASDKVRIILDALEDPVAYMPVDISGEYLGDVAERLAADYPDIEVTAVVADYRQPFAVPVSRRRARSRASLFTGSTIGNFTPEEAMGFLRHTARRLAGGGALVIGADLRKDPRLLHAAYNDSAGVTAAFNLNLLTRINRELDGTFDVSAFDHYAFYNPLEGRIEMHLVSRRPQRVTVSGRSFYFGTGESIHTENSYKFDVDGFRDMARRAGFVPEALWLDNERWFSVHLLRSP
ncbi:MAG: L-histidine N(alpha)-methyltransferase, partial [Alphaproteobacteria bacterium]|nr:L-histidine N(alpha)-methyltransferase [Alphaproteobacteria bacterium]